MTVNHKNYYLRSISKSDLKIYSKSDWIKNIACNDDLFLKKNEGTNKWLIESPPKRMIFDLMYGDLIQQNFKKKLKILDVGGGINLLQKYISKKHDLTVVDILSHDKKLASEEYCKYNKINLIQNDWYNFLSIKSDYDLIISNDLFPNVDQRLGLFIDITKAIGCRLRILLTYYNNKKFYEVKRIDGQEHMFIKPWSLDELSNLLLNKKVIDRKSKLTKKEESLFANGRKLLMMEYK